MLKIDMMDWVFLALALAVYFDATHHSIGKIQGAKGLLNMTAGGWATLASFTYIGLVPVFLYMLKRKALIAKAKEHPVHLSFPHRIFVFALLFVLPMCIPYFFSFPEPDTAQLEQLLR